jgi:hypothetical protein
MRSKPEGRVASKLTTACTIPRGHRSRHPRARPVAGAGGRASHVISVLQDYRGRGLLAPAQTDSLIARIHEFSAFDWETSGDYGR